MFRALMTAGLVSGLGLMTSSALGADYNVGLEPELRGSFDWAEETQEEVSPLSFEFGMRYFYSRGGSQIGLAGGDQYSTNDTSHILEGHLRIDDHSTQSYLSGVAGYAMIIDGTHDVPGFSGLPIAGGQVAYAGADFGYLPFGSDMLRFGGFVGYKYMNESVFTGRTSFLTASGGGDSEPTNLEIHAARLGLAAKSEFANMVTIKAEGAIIPFASLSGTHGVFATPNFAGPPVTTQGSSGALTGTLYGAEGEVMVGVKPWGNLSFNIGARASYLSGEGEMAFTRRETATPGNEQGYIQKTTDLNFFRYGLLAGVSGVF